MNIAYISLLKSVMEVYSHLNKEEIINIWKPESLNSRGKKVLKWLLSVTKLHLGHIFENSLNTHACTNKKHSIAKPLHSPFHRRSIGIGNHNTIFKAQEKIGVSLSTHYQISQQAPCYAFIILDVNSYRMLAGKLGNAFSVLLMECYPQGSERRCNHCLQSFLRSSVLLIRTHYVLCLLRR